MRNGYAHETDRKAQTILCYRVTAQTLELHLEGNNQKEIAEIQEGITGVFKKHSQPSENQPSTVSLLSKILRIKRRLGLLRKGYLRPTTRMERLFSNGTFKSRSDWPSRSWLEEQSRLLRTSYRMHTCSAGICGKCGGRPTMRLRHWRPSSWNAGAW